MFKLFRLIKYHLLKNKGLFFPKYSDDFYTFHQDRLRGPYEEIKKRQSIYLKYLKSIPLSLQKNCFLDIGFGRSEFIDLLTENRFKHVEGVDINKDYVSKARQKGYQVYHGDGLKHLYLSEKNYYGISAFHLIEHIEFNELFDLFLVCSKKLVKGGVLILETPNVENVRVGSSSFFLDPTHKLKLPSLLIKTLLKYFGFTKIEFLYLHPNDAGAQDLGIIARKL
jgi:O-antigen chain-terminating methyltransferase